MNTPMSISLMVLGVAFALTPPAEAFPGPVTTSVFVCDSPRCGSNSTTFFLNGFDGGFYVNSDQVQLGLDSPIELSVPTGGSFVDGAAKNTFTGVYVPDETIRPKGDTYFFANEAGVVMSGCRPLIKGSVSALR
jgi:hypothetical protein